MGGARHQDEHLTTHWKHNMIDERIWVLTNGQDHYTFSMTCKDGMVVHMGDGPTSGIAGTVIAEADDPKEMRPRWNTMLADGYRRNRMMEQDYGSTMSFDDLVFEDVGDLKGQIYGHQQAKLFFKNGYGVSVVFKLPDGGKCHYEVAVLKGVDSAWDICYDTCITDDVIRCNMSHHVDGLMKEIQELNNG